MKTNKSARISLAITTVVLTIALSSMLFMGAFFVNDRLERALKRPGSTKIDRALKNEDDFEVVKKLLSKSAKIEERELTIFEKAFLGLLQGSVFILTIAVLPHPKLAYGILAFGAYDQSTWSFYTQYMDKNRPLPLGSALDDYREKDFERRKQIGYKAPLYPSAMYICDANSGHVNGTADFKKEIKSFKLKIEDAHSKVLNYMEKDGNIIMEPYKLCFLGLYRDFMVFKFMDAPGYEDLQVFYNENEIKGCYLIHKKTMRVEER